MSVQPSDYKEFDVTLAKAMKMRKKLRELANTVKTGILTLPAFARKETVASHERKLTAGNSQSELMLFERILNAKLSIDLAIEGANLEGQKLLQRIATARECKDLAYKLTHDFKVADNVERRWNNVTGVDEIISLEPVLDDFSKEVAACDQEIAELEENLSEFNSTTHVKLGIDPEIAELAGF